MRLRDARRILVLIPHPDDEVVACAAAICRARRAGARVFGLYLTTGLPSADKAWPWRRRNQPGRIARRRTEARAVADLLGLEPVGWASRPARTLKDDWAAACSDIGNILDRLDIQALWTPAYEGGHQDHDVANFLASKFAGHVPVAEFAEYNYAGGQVCAHQFPMPTGHERLLALDSVERQVKAHALALYVSERGNLTHVSGPAALERETLRPLHEYDYSRPPHPGRLFWERFHWIWFQHPRIDFTSPEKVREAVLAMHPQQVRG